MTRLTPRALAALAVAAAVIAAAIVVPLVVLGGNGKGYTFTLPADWQQTSPAPAGVVAEYRRSDHTGLLTIRSESRRIVISPRFVHGIDTELQQRLPGYRPLAHHIIVTKAGAAFLFVFIQRVGGRLTSILLVPAGSRTYFLDAVTTGTSKPATRDVGTIFHSFVPQG